MGKTALNKRKVKTSRRSITGTPTSIQDRKETGVPASARSPIAMALGVVPMGVPIPPMFAEKGIASMRPRRRLASGGIFRTKGRTVVTMMAVVAVLDIHIDIAAVKTIIPKRMTGGRVPNRLRIIWQNSRSRLFLLNTLAITNPPNRSTTTGLANEARKEV